MSKHDRHLSDSLFDIGFDQMEKGDYAEGLKTLRTAAGADGFERDYRDYDPATGISHVDKISRAARGHLDEHGEYSPDLVASPRPHPAAVVFMGAEAEFKGFIERRTGRSPDYRATGFVNHLGQAIAFYRRAEKLGYPVGTWRLEALRLKLGAQDFHQVEMSYNEAAGRAVAYSNDLRDEILGKLGTQKSAKSEPSQGACYIATTVYGSYDAAPVMTLRRFRDEQLATSPIGRRFIRTYYATSPALARKLSARSPLTAAVRRVLDALVRVLDKRWGN